MAAFKGSTGRPRVLEYRKNLKIKGNSLRGLSVLFFFVFLKSLVIYLSALYSLHESQSAIQTLQLGAVEFFVIWCFFYLTYHFIYKQVLFTKIKVFKDRLEVRYKNKTIPISFSDVKSIAVNQSNRPFHSFKLVFKNRKALKIGYGLERSDYILDALMDFNPKILKKESYENLRTHLILKDHRLSRSKDLYFKKYKWLTIFQYVFLPVLVAVMLLVFQNQKILVKDPLRQLAFALLQMGIVLTVSHLTIEYFTEKFLNKKMREQLLKSAANKIRNLRLEQSIYLKGVAVQMVFFFGFVTFLYTSSFNYCLWVRLENSFDLLKVQEGDMVLVDSRFNCLDCNYPLAFGDAVVFMKNEKFVVGKLTGLPSEFVHINQEDREGRFLASTEMQAVPEKSIAVLIDEQTTVFIKIDDIKGKKVQDFSEFYSQKPIH